LFSLKGVKMQINSFKKAGEKENENLLVRLSKTQKQRIVALAEASGYKSVSDYVRMTLLNPSIEQKLNNILSLLQENKSDSLRESRRK
jgi:Arc/MetJ-type ribon-helix-helix transcriptional regulator